MKTFKNHKSWAENHNPWHSDVKKNKRIHSRVLVWIILPTIQPFLGMRWIWFIIFIAVYCNMFLKKHWYQLAPKCTAASRDLWVVLGLWLHQVLVPNGFRSDCGCCAKQLHPSCGSRHTSSAPVGIANSFTIRKWFFIIIMILIIHDNPGIHVCIYICLYMVIICYYHDYNHWTIVIILFVSTMIIVAIIIQ